MGVYPTGIAYDPNTHDVYVVNPDAGTLSVIQDSTNTVTSTLDVGTNPAGIAYDSGTGEIYVTNSNDPGTVTVTPVSSGTPSTSSPTSSASSSPTASSTPKVPEFSSAALVSVVAAMIALTASAVTLKARTRKPSKSNIDETARKMENLGIFPFFFVFFREFIC